MKGNSLCELLSLLFKLVVFLAVDTFKLASPKSIFLFKLVQEFGMEGVQYVSIS